MWFKKKRDDSHKWHNLNNTLMNSFKNIKRDIDIIHHKNSIKDKEYKQHLAYLHTRLSKIEGAVEAISRIERKPRSPEPKFELEDYYKEYKIDPDLYSDLTNLQKSILLTLSILNKETGKGWQTMKSLSQEIYPTKEYSKIKSIISYYTDQLSDLNFVKKTKKGRQTYLSLTKRAKTTIPKINKTLKRLQE